jgi:hypothetical protein
MRSRYMDQLEITVYAKGKFSRTASAPSGSSGARDPPSRWST